MKEIDACGNLQIPLAKISIRHENAWQSSVPLMIGLASLDHTVAFCETASRE